MIAAGAVAAINAAIAERTAVAVLLRWTVIRIAPCARPHLDPAIRNEPLLQNTSKNTSAPDHKYGDVCKSEMRARSRKGEEGDALAILDEP